MNNPRIEEYWSAFLASQLSDSPYLQKAYVAEAFGDGPELAEELGQLVASGTKTGTCSALWEWEAEDNPIPEVGLISIVLNGAGSPICIIETTEVTFRRFNQVDEGFARAEGEGDLSLQYWREAHIKLFFAFTSEDWQGIQRRYAAGLRTIQTHLQIMRRISNISIALLAVFLVIQAGYSTHWPIAHDEAPLLYEAFLMRVDGLVPYRDLFDFQMPGSFIAYYMLGSLSGFDGFRLRLLDLAILAALLIITFFATRRFGKTPALAAAVLFGLKYLQGGPSVSFQREYLLLIFVALGMWISMRDVLTLKHRITLGLLFGLAAIIKPHAAIGLIPILLFDITDMVKHLKLTLLNAATQSILPATAGFIIPVLAVIAWLGLTGALTPFVTIAVNYWPLYSQVSGQLVVTAGTARTSLLLSETLHLGNHGLWLIPAFIGVYLNQNKKTYLLAAFAFCYAIYPAFSGQFFQYHYIPFTYFIILLSALTFDFRPSTFSPFILQLSSFILILTLIRPSQTFLRQLENKSIVTSTDRAVEIANFLEKNLDTSQGDTVQPLDWTGGTLLAMLETRAHIATPYVFDFYFYHHVSHPYIQSLRADFMNDLRLASPRFIIEVTAMDKPWVAGEDTSREFPELRAFLNENYSITIQKDDYVIYEIDNGQ